jgi:xyloglucan-specific exo-beta-1,4-glucanase
MGTYGGKIAVSADSNTILWVPSSPSTSVLMSQFTSTFMTVSALPAGSIIAADKVNGTVLYAASADKLYVTMNSGTTWTASGNSLNGAAVKIAVNPSKAGELWVSTSSGISHSTDFGKTLTALPTVTEAWGLALGAPATSGGTPALYTAATISGKSALWHTDDNGANWYQISDSAHGFGSASTLVLAADPNTYKRSVGVIAGISCELIAIINQGIRRNKRSWNLLLLCLDTKHVCNYPCKFLGTLLHIDFSFVH